MNVAFRLLSRAEDLERLMNEEVTDINEILTVINTIQVNSNGKIAQKQKMDEFSFRVQKRNRI